MSKKAGKKHNPNRPRSKNNRPMRNDSGSTASSTAGAAGPRAGAMSTHPTSTSEFQCGDSRHPPNFSAIPRFFQGSHPSLTSQPGYLVAPGTGIEPAYPHGRRVISPLRKPITQSPAQLYRSGAPHIMPITQGPYQPQPGGPPAGPLHICMHLRAVILNCPPPRRPGTWPYRRRPSRQIVIR